MDFTRKPPGMPCSKNILLAEDDDQYAFIIQLALKQAGIQDPVRVLTSRDQVTNYMVGKGQYADREEYPMPSAIILALRPPLLDFKALHWVRQHHEFDRIRIVVLSGVKYDHERIIARDLGTDGYHVKPSSFGELVDIARRIRQRWLAPHDQQAVA